MKTVIACLLMVSALLSGCIVEPVYRGDYRGGYGYRDRDHDGVPNRYDRYDNRALKDKDRDGVPNTWDKHDRNPYRP